MIITLTPFIGELLEKCATTGALKLREERTRSDAPYQSNTPD
jgi:hypothetical protein